MSFTLTMWDVKFIEIDTGYSSLNRFTLTMWDVKFRS